jgi:hypothetical protein
VSENLDLERPRDQWETEIMTKASRELKKRIYITWEDAIQTAMLIAIRLAVADIQG